MCGLLAVVIVSDQQVAPFQIVNQSSGRQSRFQPDRPAVKPKEEKSIFSEEEFQTFQKEYFGKIVEGGVWEGTPEAHELPVE